MNTNIERTIDISVLTTTELVDLYILYHSNGERELARPFLRRLLDVANRDLFKENRSKENGAS